LLLGLNPIGGANILFFAGRGAYRSAAAAPFRSVNSLISGIPRALKGAVRAPRMTSSRSAEGGLKIRSMGIPGYGEKVCNIYAPGTFGALSGSAEEAANATEAAAFSVRKMLDINPALESLLPFASQMAANYQQYEVKKMIFKFKPSTTLQDHNGLLGEIGIAHTFDPKAPEFRDMDEVKAFHSANVGRPHSKIAHGVECAPAHMPVKALKFTRTSGVDGDLLDYDHGKLHVVTQNIPEVLAGHQLGELYVEYEITLKRQRIHTARGKAISRFESVAKDPTVAKPFGDMATSANYPLFAQLNSIDINTESTSSEFDTSTNGEVTITVPPHLSGKFELVVEHRGTNLTTTTRSIVLGGNITQPADYFSGTAAVSTVDSSGDDQTTQMSKYALEIRPSTRNTPNTITVKRTFDAGSTLESSSLILQEHNPFTYDDKVRKLVNPLGVPTAFS